MLQSIERYTVCFLRSDESLLQPMMSMTTKLCHGIGKVGIQVMFMCMQSWSSDRGMLNKQETRRRTYQGSIQRRSGRRGERFGIGHVARDIQLVLLYYACIIACISFHFNYFHSFLFHYLTECIRRNVTIHSMLFK